MTKRTRPCSRAVRARAVRMDMGHREEHGSQWATIRSIASKIGCSGGTLRNWMRRAERDDGPRAGPTRQESERIKAPTCRLPAGPDQLPARAKRDACLKMQVSRVFNEDFGVQDVGKVRRPMAREGFDVVRCRGPRLTRQTGL